MPKEKEKLALETHSKNSKHLHFTFSAMLILLAWVDNYIYYSAETDISSTFYCFLNSVQQWDSENLTEACREAQSQCVQTCLQEMLKVSGTDPATVLAKDPFPVSCLEKGWSLWLAIQSLRYLAPSPLLQNQFWCPTLP